MKVGIVTIYNSQNCGSFLQAYSMQSFLEENGLEPVIIKNRIFKKNTFMYKLVSACVSLVSGRPAASRALLGNYFEFKKIRKLLKIQKGYDGVPVCIYGSDTIWNMESPYFSKEWRHYWGRDFTGKKIAYAASVGGTEVNRITGDAELCACVRDFYALAVRDKNTNDAVARIRGNEYIPLVVDPTMLMKREFFERLAVKPKKEGYALFYCFEPIDTAFFGAIADYAKQNRLNLFSFGGKIKNCDEVFEFLPQDMMSLYKNADFVITDTFHGTVFSLIFNKPFIAVNRNKKKVNDLINTFGLNERLVTSVDELNAALHGKIDFDSVNSVLEEKRKFSGDYLLNSVKNSLGDV